MIDHTLWLFSLCGSDRFRVVTGLECWIPRTPTTQRNTGRIQKKTRSDAHGQAKPIRVESSREAACNPIDSLSWAATVTPLRLLSQVTVTVGGTQLEMKGESRTQPALMYTKQTYQNAYHDLHASQQCDYHHRLHTSSTASTEFDVKKRNEDGPATQPNSKSKQQKDTCNTSTHRSI